SANAAAQQVENAGSVFEHYKAFLAFRKQHKELITGEIHFWRSGPDVLAFERILGDTKLLCLFNLSEKAAKWLIPEGAELEPVFAPGFQTEMGSRTVKLGGLQAFFGRLVIP
ncbi:MAG: alpha-glucosidase C-terminal domain-containing protein, partial [Notoacmeibacter sp.]